MKKQYFVTYVASREDCAEKHSDGIVTGEFSDDEVKNEHITEKGLTKYEIENVRTSIMKENGWYNGLVNMYCKVVIKNIIVLDM